MSARGHVTISIGVAVARPSIGQSERGLMKAADVALYEAKRVGRNCVYLTFYGTEPATASDWLSGDGLEWMRKPGFVDRAHEPLRDPSTSS